jgi:hypothetical protein
MFAASPHAVATNTYCQQQICCGKPGQFSVISSPQRLPDSNVLSSEGTDNAVFTLRNGPKVLLLHKIKRQRV